MSVKYQEPTIVDSDSLTSETIERHPAYGQIGASRVSGQTFLYGTDFAHQNYIIIEISRSELHRGLSNDWPFGRDKLIELALSEAQWATFVSSLNCGQGVQCTLTDFNRESIPQIPAIKSRKAQFQAEADS